MIDQDDLIKQQLLVFFNKLEGIIPISYKFFLKDSGYIAGGAIVSLALDENPNDIDIFFKHEDVAAAFRSYFKRDQRYVKAITPNAITLEIEGMVYQLVTRFTGPVERVFKTFDFEHCKCYFDLATEDLIYNPTLIHSKELIYSTDDQYPLTALKRLVRFTKRGWRPTNQTILDIAQRLSALDLKNEKVYNNQVIGFYGSSME